MDFDTFRPQLWHDFFVMVGGAAAVLTGLVFVGISLSVDAITEDETYLHRSIGTLTGFGSAFVVSALALVPGQSSQVFGAEWLLAAIVSMLVYWNGITHARLRGGSSTGLTYSRVGVGILLNVTQIAGAAMLATGVDAGLLVAVFAMLGLLVFMISGAWLLIPGAEQHKARQTRMIG